MYKNGLNFPSFFILMNDDFQITKLEEILSQMNFSFLNGSEIETSAHIIHSINNCAGYELYSFLLNHFSFFVQTEFSIKSNQIESKFVKKVEFANILKTFKVDFMKIENLLSEYEKIGKVNRSMFYRELYLLLYRSFAIKLAEVISYSDSLSSNFFIDFNNYLDRYNEYRNELSQFRPNVIEKYDFKLNYLSSVRIFLRTEDDAEIEKRISVIINHTDRNILATFRHLIHETFTTHEGIDPKRRNKVFRPIFAEIASAIKGKIYDSSNQDSLTREVKKFFLTM